MMKKYYEVVLEGSFEIMKGFVIGFLEGRGIQGEAVFGEEHHVENESMFGQLMRLIGRKGDQAHLIIGSGFHELLSKAIERRKEELDLKVVSVREIGDAHFEFRFKAFTRELGAELKARFDSLPEGLTMGKGYEAQEKSVPEGKGVEAYAPLHEYELRAKGEIHGSIKAAIDFYGEIEHHDMVELGNIRLEYVD